MSDVVRVIPHFHFQTGMHRLVKRLTIYTFALGQVGVLLAVEEAVAISSDNAFDIPASSC